MITTRQLDIIESHANMYCTLTPDMTLRLAATIRAQPNALAEIVSLCEFAYDMSKQQFVAAVESLCEVEDDKCTS